MRRQTGSQRRGVLEEIEKAHVYIEQLNRRLGEKEEQIAGLQAQLNQLQDLVSSLASTEETSNR